MPSEFHHDVIFDAFWLGSGLAEINLKRDRHGFFELRGNPLFEARVFQRPLLSELGAWIANNLKEFRRISLWPESASMAVCASHDVDYPEVKRVIEPLRILKNRKTGGIRLALEVFLGVRHHWKFNEWIATEQQMGMKSAFYFTARKGSLIEFALGTPDPFYDVRDQRFVSVIRQLISAGFEVGMQASYNAYRNLEVFLAEKQRIEEVIGRPVLGNRHHYWLLNPVSPEDTLIIHEKAGLRYDTSLSFEQIVGWRRGIACPYFPFSHRLKRPLRTLQIPTVWMDDQLFSHADYNPGDRSLILQNIVSTCVRLGGVMLVDMHEYVFDEKLFP